MNRINISVDLDNNEVLQESIREALRGEARKIAREVFSQVLQEEIDRIADSKIKLLKDNAYINPIQSEVVSVLARKVSKEVKVDSDMIDELIQVKVDTYMNRKLEVQGGMAPFVDNFMARSVAATFLQNTKEEK